MKTLALTGFTGILALGILGTTYAAEPGGTSAQYPLDGEWYIEFICGDGGWADLVTVANGKMTHEYEWESGDRIDINGTFDRSGEVEINGRFVFKQYGAQRIWATGKKENVWSGGEKSGIRIDGWVKIGRGGGGCESLGHPYTGEEFASGALEQHGQLSSGMRPNVGRRALAIYFGPGGFSFGISDLPPK